MARANRAARARLAAEAIAALISPAGGARDAARAAAGHGLKRAKHTSSEGVLEWLRRRKDKLGRPLITGAQFSAGEMLGSDFWHAQLLPRVTANWSAVVPGNRVRRSTPGFGVEMRDAVLAARQRFYRALDAVGPELSGILVDVCCGEVGLEAAGRSAGWQQGAARAVLDLALTRLARHYGLIAPERPAASRLRHWAEPDYRPTIDAWR